MKAFTVITISFAVFVLLGTADEILAREAGRGSDERPRAHEYYTPCDGLECNDRSCAEPGPKPCPLICLPGFLCEDDYVRESIHGPCILPTNCPKNSEG